MFTNLATLLPEEERYSYLFDGNSQLLDNILVSRGLVAGASYDAVHINAEFRGVRPTDHDPQVALLRIAITPHDIVVSDSSIDENLPAGSVVGTLSASDTVGDVLRFTLVDDAEGRFAVDAATGIVTTTRGLNFEAAANYAIVARVTDSAGLFSEQALTIAVGDVNEAPVAAADAIAVDEDAASENLWAQLLGNDVDVDAGDTLTISAVDASATLGSLVFDAATQTLRYVADDDAFDALAPGATANDRFIYTVTDKSGLSHTATVNVTVTGIADGVTRNGGNGIDLLTGTGGEDRLFGDNGNDMLFGLDGHDRLDGGRGDDALFGGVGNDWLIGGQGNDSLSGGAGADVFHFDAKSGSDVILDFNTAEDRLSFAADSGVRSSQALDLNRDGVADLMLSLAGGGSVTLYGVAALGEVVIGASSGGMQSVSVWAVESADSFDAMMLARLSGDHFLSGM